MDSCMEIKTSTSQLSHVHVHVILSVRRANDNSRCTETLLFSAYTSRTPIVILEKFSNRDDHFNLLAPSRINIYDTISSNTKNYELPSQECSFHSRVMLVPTS